MTDVDNAPATATVSVTVHRAPTARDASVTTPANTALTYDLSPLAFDPDGDTLTWAVGAASHGMAELQFVTGGGVIYTPNAGYVGMDSFTYTVTDGHGVPATGTITVAVGAVKPTVTIASGATHPTKDAFTVTLAFSESVTGLVASEVAVTNGTASGLRGSGTTYSLTVTPDADYEGDVTVEVAADVALSNSNIGNAAASQAFAVDTATPTVAITSGASHPTKTRSR